MRRIKIENLQEGDVLAADIYDQLGNILERQGRKFISRHIEFLYRFGIKEIFIEDEYNNGIIELDEMLKSTYKATTIRSLRTKNIAEITECGRLICKQIIDKYKSDIMIDELVDARNERDKIYQKALQVCKYSLAVAKNMKINDQSTLNNLAISSLLHNLGESFLGIPSTTKRDIAIDSYFNLIEKNDKKLIDEKEVVDNYFYTKNSIDEQKIYSNIYLVNFLKDNPYVNNEILYTVMSYKENLDGTGFPFRYKSEQIPTNAKIIRVCSDYDTLVNENDMSPLDAIIEMQKSKGKKYDATILNTLSRTVAIYPKGVEVNLSDGRKALVFENHLAHPDKPIIIFKDGTTLDLKDENLDNITITGYSVRNIKNQNNLNK